MNKKIRIAVAVLFLSLGISWTFRIMFPEIELKKEDISVIVLFSFIPVLLFSKAVSKAKKFMSNIQKDEVE